MKRLLFTITTLLAASGCTTTGTVENPVAKRRVIDRSAGHDQTPDWVRKSNKFAAEDNRIGFKGFLTMDADSRAEACTHASGVEAKGRISSLIASSILDESGIAGDDKTIVYNRLTAVLSKQKLVGIEIADEFWQLVEIDDGDTKTRKMECWSKVTIDKRHFENAISRALADLGDDAVVMKHKQRLESRQEHMLNEQAPAH